MALAPFGFSMDPFFGTRPRDLRTFDRVMDDWASSLVPIMNMPTMNHAPTIGMDIVESDSAFTVQADAPGFDPEDVNIELKEGRITISGRKDEDKKQEQDGKVVRRERSSVSFSRTFALPDNVREDDISASLDKGVLTVTLPKQDPAPKPQPKRIAVQGAAAPETVHAVKDAAPAGAHWAE